jgi:hypothetical protein
VTTESDRNKGWWYVGQHNAVKGDQDY